MAENPNPGTQCEFGQSQFYPETPRASGQLQSDQCTKKENPCQKLISALPAPEATSPGASGAGPNASRRLPLLRGGSAPAWRDAVFAELDYGFRRARRVLLDISDQGLPAGTEFLDPITPQFIADFAGEDRYILDYLLSEVLQQQSADRQTFLLRTALLEELNADLCAAVTGYPRADMQAILQTLEQENVFLIPLDNRRETYRYHHLFADLF